MPDGPLRGPEAISCNSFACTLSIPIGAFFDKPHGQELKFMWFAIGRPLDEQVSGGGNYSSLTRLVSDTIIKLQKRGKQNSTKHERPSQRRAWDNNHTRRQTDPIAIPKRGRLGEPRAPRRTS